MLCPSNCSQEDQPFLPPLPQFCEKCRSTDGGSPGPLLTGISVTVLSNQTKGFRQYYNEQFQVRFYLCLEYVRKADF